MRTSFYFSRYHYYESYIRIRWVGRNCKRAVMVRRDGDITLGTKWDEVKRGNGILMTGWKWINERALLSFSHPNMVILISLSDSTLFVR